MQKFMDYEKKYKELNKKVAVRFGSNVARELFPDLYESEDEKIRKAIKIYLEDMPDSYGFGPGIGKKEMIAYLERQKEQKPERINVTEMVEKYRVIDEYVEGEYKGKPVNCMIRAYEQGVRDTLSKVKEQKPAEWSEEDVEKLAKNRASKSGTLKSEMIFYRQGVRDAFNYKGMCPHWKPGEEQMAALKEQTASFACENIDDRVLLESLYNDLKKL